MLSVVYYDVCLIYQMIIIIDQPSAQQVIRCYVMIVLMY